VGGTVGSSVRGKSVGSWVGSELGTIIASSPSFGKKLFRWSCFWKVLNVVDLQSTDKINPQISKVIADIFVIVNFVSLQFASRTRGETRNSQKMIELISLSASVHTAPILVLRNVYVTLTFPSLWLTLKKACVILCNFCLFE